MTLVILVFSFKELGIDPEDSKENYLKIGRKRVSKNRSKEFFLKVQWLSPRHVMEFL